MDLYEMHREINRAEQTLRNADEVATSIARILRGRLRHIPNRVAADLKRELQNFNGKTKEWKD